VRILNAAVVGTGFIGPVHVEAVRRLGHGVAGILGSSPAKSAAAAESLRLPRAYSSFEELIQDREVDVVHLASPNRLHFEQCRLALAAGKHVVCEKPLAMNAMETAELAELAAASPLITAVNYNVRFYPHVLEMRRRRLSNDLGDVVHVLGSYLQDWLLLATDYNWRVDAGEGGALRAVADIGTHWFDTCCFITGLEAESVFADLGTLHKERLKPTGGTETFTGSAAAARTGTPVSIATEDFGTILVRFRGGARACFSVSQVNAGRKNCIRFDIAGTKCSFSWDSESPNRLHIGHRERANEIVERGPGDFSDYPGGHAEGFPDSFKMLYRAIYNDILNGTKSAEPLYATFADGHREVQFCEAVLESHRVGVWVKF
jgi:predicted dehydrogenase